MILTFGTIFDSSETHLICNEIMLHTVRKGKKTYYNIPSAFDIEVTSTFSRRMEKTAFMYVWQFGLNGAVTFGRTWEDFVNLLNEISDVLELNSDKLLVVYVHNLEFEFQFMRKWFTWQNVFAMDSRKVLYATTSNGIEFRCSYLLSGYSLAKLSDNLLKYRFSKMVGDLDYSKIRHRGTPLDYRETGYCINDVVVPMAFIQEKIERGESIADIPLTKTGYVRNATRKQCFYNGKSRKGEEKTYRNYRKLMDGLTIETADEYNQLKRAFSGGFTHASCFKSGKIYSNVGSIDFTSSYPYVMISEKYPMGIAGYYESPTREIFLKSLELYCCIFDIELINIEQKILYEHILSKSKCIKYSPDIIVDNGRIVAAGYIKITLTDVDFSTLDKFYSWEKYKVTNLRTYYRAYLPKGIVQSTLNFYVSKTSLKGVEGKEIEYLNGKENLNANYGMMVTDICRTVFEYEGDDWLEPQKPNLNEVLPKYNKNKKRFLYYPWGVFVTAYARKNLYSGILEFGGDYIYSDTDSIKALNMEKHMGYIERYNMNVISKLKIAMKYHGMSFELTCPKNKKGQAKQLGVWDYEGNYTLFKTLGAKRYIYEKPGEGLNITVSGVNKYKAVPYLLSHFPDVRKIFEEFKDGLRIPEEYTGKLTHTYIDFEQTGNITDYMGNISTYNERSSVHMEGAAYQLSIAPDYQQLIEYLKGVDLNED